jgi:hypothetical protein
MPDHTHLPDWKFAFPNRHIATKPCFSMSPNFAFTMFAASDSSENWMSWAAFSVLAA